MSNRKKIRRNKSKSRRNAQPDFEVEQMERRLLLSANLYDPNAAAGDTQVRDQVFSQIVETLDQVGNLGKAVNEDGQDDFVPLIDETLADLGGSEFGDFFRSAAGDADIANLFQTAAPTSGGLALALETALSDYGLSGSVTDNSTADQLDLQFDLSSGLINQQTDIRLGQAEEEMNLRIQDGTTIDLARQWQLSFAIEADLSSIAETDPLDRLAGLGDNKFRVDLSGNDSYTIDANSQHTSTSNILGEFGVQLGLLGMRESANGAGAFAFTGTDFRLDVSGQFDFSNGVGSDGFDLTELKTFETNDTWSDAWEFAEDNGSRVEMITQVGIDNPSDDTYIGGLDGVTGTFTLKDEVLFDESVAQITIDETLGSFSRLTSQDILNMAGGVAGWAAALQASDLYDENIPFLDLSTGDAYAFGQAFQDVFLAQLQDVEQVLTARNAPSTTKNGQADPLNFSGQTSFFISVNNNSSVVTLPTNSGRNTLQALVTDLNNALPAGVSARLTETNSPRLEFFSDENTNFLISQLTTGAEGQLDLGFDTLQELALANDATTAFGGAFTDAEQLQFDGIVYESSGSVDVADFATAQRSLTFEVNGKTPITVSIPQLDYSNLEVLIAQLNNRLSEAGVHDPETGSGVQVEAHRTSDGIEGVRILGGSDVFSLNISGDATTHLNISAGLQTSEYLEFQLNGDTTVTYRTYLVGNTTGRLLDGAANSSVDDIVADLNFGLENNTYRYDNGTFTGKEALLDTANGEGIDIRGQFESSTDQVLLQFFARNPGNDTSEIQSFQLTNQSAGLAVLGFTPSAAAPFATGKVVISPNFDTIQEFAERIANSPISLTGDAPPSFDTNSLTFNFPVQFEHTPDDLIDDPATTEENEAIALDLAEDYGHISAVESDSRVEVERTSTSNFHFQVSLASEVQNPEVLSVELPVLFNFWDGILTTDSLLTVIFDDGVQHELLVTAESTANNIETNDFVLQLADEIADNPDLNGKITVSMETQEDGLEIIVFTTDPNQTDTRILQVIAPDETSSPVAITNAAVDVLGFSAGKTTLTSVTDELVAPLATTGFNLNRHTLISVELLDGHEGVIFLDSVDTADNTSLEDLVADLNFAIMRSEGLSTIYDGGKVEAFADADSGTIGFRLNSELYPDDGSYTTENWSIEVFADYNETSPNGAIYDIDLPKKTADTALAGVPMTALTQKLTGNDPFYLTSAANIQISVNGSEFVSVIVPAGNPGATLGELLADINQSIANTTVNIGAAPFALSDFLRASMSENGEQIAIRAINPDVITMRVFADPNTANNSAVTQLGFGETEQRAGWRGGQVYLDHIKLSGTATVEDQAVAAKGNFGFAEFEANNSELDLNATTSTLFGSGAATRFSLYDLNDLVSSDQMGTVSITTVAPETFVSLKLGGLQFTGDSVDGLTFDANASITIEHVPTDSASTVDGFESRITDFSALADPFISYHNTAGLETLSGLEFADIFQNLIRTGEFISDQMKIDPDGSGAAVNAYATKLLFVKSGLVDAFDFGYEFEQTIAQLIEAPPAKLQDLKSVLASTLQIDASEIQVSLATEYQGDNLLDSSSLKFASIEISLPFVKTFAVALPLFIDLAQLRNRSSDPAIVKDYLAGLDALASTSNNPMDVSLSILAELDLSLGVEIVSDFESQTPQGILHDSTTIETDFNLAGSEFNGDLPVGNARFRLTDGQVAINETGETEVNDQNNTERIYNELALTPDYIEPFKMQVDVATTVDLLGSYNSGSGTLQADTNGALIVDGVAVNVGDLILVNNQEDNFFNVGENYWDLTESDLAQNGIYKVVSTGSANSAWSLVRDTAADTATELNDLYVTISGGDTYAGRDFLQTTEVANVGADSISFAKLIDPAQFAINLNDDFQLPYAVHVGTTSALEATYSSGPVPSNPAQGARLTALTNISLNEVESTLANGKTVSGIDGQNDLSEGDLILIKDQPTTSPDGDLRYQNGVYKIIDIGETGTEGRAWVLERVDFADEVGDMVELRVAVQQGRDNQRLAFVQSTNTLGAISAGEVIAFTSDLARVYSDFDNGTFRAVADINPEGQAQAYLPITIVVTGEDGNEIIINKDTSQLTDEQANDDAFMATQPTFDPVNIRVVSYGGRSGLDRMFDLNVPSNVPNVPAPVVFFANPDLPADELPPLGRNIPPVDVLQVLRDPFLMGDALDLALFNLQFAIDQALGNELPLLGLDLPSYTLFIENWRNDFTNQLRDELRNNKLKPINAVLDSLTQALGPGGIGLISGRDAITVEVLDASETVSIWDPSDANNYDLTPLNEEFEVTPASAVSLQFSLDLVKEMDTSATEVNIDQIYMPEELGLEIDTETTRLNTDNNPIITTGGVNLRTSFTLHLGFGVDINEGFYLYNPTDDGVGEQEALMEIDVEAVLDGDIHTEGVQIFEQNKRTSKLNLLDVQIADAMSVPDGSKATNGEDLDGASGFYGTFEFFLNSGSGGLDNQRTTIPDLQIRNTLGVDPALVPPGSLSNFDYGTISFDLNGDIDIDLLIAGNKEGSSFGSGGGIPDIETELYFQQRMGTGYENLSYVSQTVYDQAVAAVANQTATDEQKAIADQPDFRVLRDLIDGAVYDYTNISIDAQGFLEGTIFEMLQKFSEGFSPLRPILDTLLKPIPGTTWMDQPLILGDLFGAKFVAFAKLVVRIDNMIQALTEGIGSPTTPRWARPRVNLEKDNFLGTKKRKLVGGTLRKVGISTEYGKKSVYEEERSRVKKYEKKRDDTYRKRIESNRVDKATRDFYKSVGVEDDRTTSRRMRDAFNQKVLTPNKHALRFEKFRDKQFAEKKVGGGFVNKLKNSKTLVKNAVKKSYNQGTTGTNDRGGRKNSIANMSGGGIRLDALKVDSIHLILNGQEANLSYLELPKIELGIAYSRSFPLPAFPPLMLTVGMSVSINTHLKFGWDTQGFYWSTLDTFGNPSPAFGVSATFSVGVALNFGLIEVGVQAFFTLDIDFNWNDITVPSKSIESNFIGSTSDRSNRDAIGFGKLRGEQIDFLKNMPGADGKMGNLFDVTLTGTVGLTFYIDLTIPVPLVGPITKRIASKTFSIKLFQVKFYAEKPGIQLGSMNGNTLTLHMGEQFASLRLFGDTTARNEVFTLVRVSAGSSVGEKVKIRATLKGQEYESEVFDNVTKVKGFAGGGQSVINASDLVTTMVEFTGGSGNSMLYASAATGSILRGGTGTATLYGAANNSNTLIGGSGNTQIFGGTAADVIQSGLRSDILAGGGGGDRYVFVDNYGRDRLFVTGQNNTVDFSGVEADLTLNLGRLVQSAKSGTNTIFFAPDSAGLNTIDTWIAGSGDDRINTYFFKPNSRLSIDGGQGDNFYAIALGNQSKRYFADIDPTASTLLGRMDPRNIGRIHIADGAGTGHVLIKQFFPERINYDRFSVDNGREQVSMTGIRTVDLDAGDATVVWGRPGQEWVDLGIGATVTAGTVEMRSNVEAEGLNLFLKRSFSITKALNLRNNSDLNITIQNPDPLASANLFIGPGPGGNGNITAGIYSSSGSVFSGGVGSGAPDGNGSGLIRINTPTGGVLNGAFGPGVIQALQGEVAIDARDTVGYDLDPVTINAKYFAAKTSKEVSTLAEGINVRSDIDLHIAYVDGIDGLLTQSGRVELTTDPGNTLYYGNIVAGGGRDVIVNTDDLVESPGRSYTVTEIQAVPGFIDIPHERYVLVRHVYYRFVWSGWLSYRYRPYVYYTFEKRVTYTRHPVTNYVPVEVTKLSPAGGSIDSAGNVFIRNVSDDMNVRVGGSPGMANTLNVTKDMLDTISSSAQSIVIGRNESEDILTGIATLENYHYNKALILNGSQIEIPGTGDFADLTSTAKIELTAYEGAGNGNIHFHSNASPIIAPTILASAFRDIRVDTDIESTTANGLVQLKAGQGASTTGAANNTGSLFLDASASISTSAPGGNIILESGLTNGDVLLSGPISSANNMSIHALGGRISQDPASQLSAINLEARAKENTNLRTNVETITLAEVTGNSQTLTILEQDALIIDEAKTNEGNLFLTTGDGLTVGKLDTSRSADISINAGGEINAYDLSPASNITTRKLSINAAGGVGIVSDIETLDLTTSATGDVIINNQGGLGNKLTLNRLITHDGLIQVDTESDLHVASVASLTSDSANTITLRTKELFGGDITVDSLNAGADGNILLQAGGLTAGGGLTHGGTITSDLGTNNRIVGKELTVLASGWDAYPGTDTINIRTDVDDLIARALAGGDPTELDSQGDITVDELSDIRLRWVDTISGDITIQAGNNIVHQAVRAPNADISLQAGGSITAQLDNTLSDGVAPLPAKLLGKNLTVQANGAIDINTTVDSMDVTSQVSGDIDITESDSAVFTSVTTEDGNIDITAGEFDTNTQLITKGGNAVLGNIQAGATGDDDVKLTVYGQARSSGQTDDGGNLIPGDPSLGTAKIHAANLDASTHGRMDLVTNIDTLTAQTFEIGNIEFLEDDAITIDSLISHSGSIDLTASGTVTSLFVESKEDIDQPATFDISIHATAGDVLVDKIDAGGQFNDIIILSDLGNIEELNPQDLDDSHEGTAPGGIDLKGDHVKLTAAGSIGGVRDLETEANSIEAHSTVAGNIEIDERDAVDLTDVDTQNGTIHFDTGGTITVTDVESLTDSDANDITLHNTQGDILINKLNAGATAGDVFLTSDTGGIDEVSPTDVGVDLTADHAQVSAAKSFGGNQAIETELNTVIAHVFEDGGIGLNEETTITLISLEAEDGRVDITAKDDIFALDIRTNTDTAGNSMSFDAGGTLWVDQIIAGAYSNAPSNPATAANIVMTADIIDELASDTDIDLRAALLSMEARGGNVASVADPFETTASTIRSVSNLGENSIHNFSDAPVEVTEYITNEGTMQFEQFGSEITFDIVRNNKGNVSIIHHFDGNMRLNDVTLNDGNLFLNVRDSGRLQLLNAFVDGNSFFKADEMDFTGPFDGVKGTGKLDILHDNPLRGTYVNPYYGEEDLAIMLEVDVHSLARLEYNDGIFFLGNVLFLEPLASFFSNIGSGSTLDSENEEKKPEAETLADDSQPVVVTFSSEIAKEEKAADSVSEFSKPSLPLSEITELFSLWISWTRD